jgi:hypothetical protein
MIQPSKNWSGNSLPMGNLRQAPAGRPSGPNEVQVIRAFFLPRQKVQFSVLPQFGRLEIPQIFQKATLDRFKDCVSNMAMLLKHLLSCCCCAAPKAELLTPAVTRIN